MVRDDRVFSVADSYPVVTLNPSGWVYAMMLPMRLEKRTDSSSPIHRVTDQFALVAARFLPRRDSIELASASGGTITVPRRAPRQFDSLPADAPKALVVSATGD